MSKRLAVVIGIVAVALFGGILYYGWAHRWGGPPAEQLQQPLVMEVPYIDSTPALEPDDFEGKPWSTLTPVTVPLVHQVTWRPWGRDLTPEVRVSGFHNGSEAYFLLEWQDPVESRTHDVSAFPDAVAMAFPLAAEERPPSLLMGFLSPIDIWHWKADLDTEYWNPQDLADGFSSNSQSPYAERADLPARAKPPAAACQNLVSARPGTLTEKEESELSGRGLWEDGKWRVIFRRPLNSPRTESDVQFGAGESYAAFAVWNGDRGDRGSRKSISDWLALQFEPAGAASAEGGDMGLSLAAPGIAPALAPAVLAWTQPPAKHRPEKVIELDAARFRYMPSEITVQKGDLVKMRMESLDVTHGFYLDGYGVQMKASPGEVGRTSFVANRTGRFTFRCSETCGPFHPYMVGYLTVEPNRRFHVFLAVVGAAFLGAGTVVMKGAFGRKEDE